MAASYSTYYQTILARAYAIHPTLIADESIFQTLFLALVARRKSIIVRTPDRARVMTLAVNILHSLFGLSIIKLRLNQRDKLSPDEFLRLLFLENPAHHGHATSRLSLRKTLNAGGNHTFAFRRSSSYPIPSGEDPPELGLYYEYYRNSLEKPELEHGLLSSARSVTLHDRQSLPRAHTDPTPLMHNEKVDEAANPSLFPNALVVSGLENSSESVQSALWTAMSEGRISIRPDHQSHPVDQRNSLCEGEWHLPSDFFVVYVCPLGNGFDCPPVHRSLIDRFAISIEAYPHIEIGRDSTVLPITPTEPEGAPVRPVLSPPELADLRVLAGSTHTIIGSRADLYLSDLLSAVRNHPHLDGTYITARCRAETEQLLRAWRAVFGTPPESDGLAFPTLDVTDEDVRKVFVIAIQHRVNVLGGPRDEVLANLVFRAVGDHGEEEWEVGRRSVKEILKEILEVV